ncbi:MAG: nucleoside-diphosphate sugar epimerase/dehydratase [Bacteroidales bacterium]
MIFLLDISIVVFSLLLSYMLRFNFHVPEREMQLWPMVFGTVLSVRALSFIIARTYAGIIRYTSTEDATRIFVVGFTGSLLFAVLNVIFYYFINGRYVVPFSILIIEFITTVFAMVAYRVIVKIAYLELTNPAGSRSPVVIFGAGDAGLITKRVLDRDVGTRYRVIAFVDDDRSKWGKKIEGITITGFDSLEEILQRHDVEFVIIAVQNLKPGRKQNLVDICLNYNTKVLTLPPVSNWINGELSFNQIRNIRIEDLLEREEIKLSTERVSGEVSGKTILVTGASGSIGSELVRQLARFNPGKVILIDQAESAMFHLELELSQKFPELNFEIAIADICNESRMRKAFELFRPSLVYHAAAYKHVPMMENNPSEAVYTNVKGTRIVADLSLEAGVEKFIMVSTDKAVNPTNVMGASKRIAEMYVQALNGQGKTRFITTRFGNVLGSNGSAVNLFRSQIEKGGPVTVTHPDIIRYFMTIPEACRLVLEAGVMGKGGEIFLFDMGEPVKILDLARRMIRLAGLTEGKDIEITFTGLRPGEKLYEELLNDGENTLPTHHPRILIARVKTIPFELIRKQVIELEEMFPAQDNFGIVKKMKEIVPEFRSRNSVYEALDKDEK